MVSKKWVGKVQVVGIGWNGTRGEIDDFIGRHGLTFTNVHDTDGSIFASFGVPGQPAWVFQTAAGERDTALGALSEADVEARMTALVAPD